MSQPGSAIWPGAATTLRFPPETTLDGGQATHEPCRYLQESGEGQLLRAWPGFTLRSWNSFIQQICFEHQWWALWEGNGRLCPLHLTASEGGSGTGHHGRGNEFPVPIPCPAVTASSHPPLLLHGPPPRAAEFLHSFQETKQASL